MVDIKKYDVDGYNCFDIVTDEGTFQILFCNNLDLYWRYDYKGNFLNTPDSKDFFITKENYFLYSLFEDLYNDVKENNLFPNDPFYDKWIKRENDFSDDNLDKFYLEYERNNLFLDDKIEWYCDDFDSEVAPSFVIEKLDNCYKLTFKKCMDDSIYASYTVRLRNSGSRYGYFNIVFMRMYQKLCQYDPKIHQVHMEEYLYHKRLIKKKETI